MIQDFLHCLWVVKDNAAYEDRGWTVTVLPTGHHIHNNHWNARKFMADGSAKDVTFDRVELKGARLLVSTDAPRYLREGDQATALTDQEGRVSRFVYFLQCARDTDDLAMKIVQYFSGLEALVSTSNTELTHQISERVAALLEPPGESRISMFEKLRRGYGIRSQAVHGSGFRKTAQSSLRDIAIEVDEICRRLLHKIYFDRQFANIFEVSNEKFAAHFHKLILGSADQIQVETHDRD
jgi:hypothetical protein